MKRNVSTMQLPLVKLSNRKERDAHKQPLEKDWKSKTYTIEQARQFLLKSYGVGLDISRFEGLAVLDIDTKNIKENEKLEAVESFVNHACKEGFLVCLSANAGYHVFLPASLVQNISGNRATISLNEVEVECEVYKYKDSARQIVLPIAGTPREWLGGKVLYFKGNKIDRAVSLEEFISYCLELVEMEFDVNLRCVSLDTGYFDKNKNSMINSFLSFINRSKKDVTEGDLIEGIKKTTAGKRHYNILSALYIAKRKGFDLEKIKQVAIGVLGGDRSAEREVENIVAWIEQKVKSEIQSNGFDVDDKAPKFVRIYQKLFEEKGVVVYKKKVSDNYVLLFNGMAYDEDGLGVYVLRQGVKISTSGIKDLYKHMLALAEEKNNAVIIRDFWRSYSDYTFAAAKKGVELGFVVAGNGEFGFRNISDVHSRFDNIYLHYNAKCIDASNIDNREYVKKMKKNLVEFIYNYADVDEHCVERTALILSALAANVSSVFIFEGESNSGKSTLAHVLTMLANGHQHAVKSYVYDVRDLSAVAENTKCVLIDDVNVLVDQIVGYINTMTTMEASAERKLHTNKDLSFSENKANFIITTTSLRKVRPDMLRRSVVIKFQKLNKIVEEEVVREVIKKNLDGLRIAFLHFMKDYKKPLNEEEAEDFMFSNQKLGSMHKPVGKMDLYHTYTYLCQKLGVKDQKKIDIFWSISRRQAAAINIEPFDLIVNKVYIDKSFAERMKNGLSASDIANEIYEDYIEKNEKGNINEDKKEKIINSLKHMITSKASKVTPLLYEAGFVLKEEKRQVRKSNGNIIEKKFFVIEKIEQEEQYGIKIDKTRRTYNEDDENNHDGDDNDNNNSPFSGGGNQTEVIQTEEVRTNESVQSVQSTQDTQTQNVEAMKQSDTQNEEQIMIRQVHYVEYIPPWRRYGFVPDEEGFIEVYDYVYDKTIEYVRWKNKDNMNDKEFFEMFSYFCFLTLFTYFDASVDVEETQRRLSLLVKKEEEGCITCLSHLSTKKLLDEGFLLSKAYSEYLKPFTEMVEHLHLDFIEVAKRVDEAVQRWTLNK